MTLFFHMLFRRYFSLQLVLVLFFSSMCQLQASPSIGDMAPPFSTLSIEGTSVSLDSLKGKVIVLEWVNPSTPYVTKYYSKETSKGMGYIQSLQRQFTQPSVGVVWLSIAPTPKGSFGYLTPSQWSEKIAEWGATPTAVLMDETGKISHLYGITVTPEVCIIDKSGKLVYRGAIDSIRGEDPSDIERVTNMHWFQTALENVIQGRRVYTSETIPYGIRIETQDDKSLFFSSL